MLMTATAPEGARVTPFCPRRVRPAATAHLVLAPVLLVLCLTTEAAAAPVSAVRVEEKEDLSVKVTIEVRGAPTFQVFRLPGRDAFAVELPGSDLRQARRFLGQDKVLLQRANVEAEREPPRVLLEFYDEVDYDAQSSDGQLEVLFRPLSGRTALRKAHALRVEEAADRKRSDDALAEARRVLAAERAAVQKVSLELDEKRAQLSELERSRASLQRDVAEEQRALGAARSQVEAAKHALGQLEQDRTALGRDVEALRKQSAEEQTKLDERKRDGLAAQGRLEQLRRELEESEARRASLDNQIAALARSAEERARETDIASARQRELTNGIAEMERARAAERASLDAEKAERARLQKAIEDQRRALATLVKQASEEDARRDAAQKERAATLAENEASTHQLQEARKQLEALARRESELRRRLEAPASGASSALTPTAPALAANHVPPDAEHPRLVTEQQQRVADGERRLQELERQVARAEGQLQSVKQETTRESANLQSLRQETTRTSETLQSIKQETTRATEALQNVKAGLDQAEQRRQQLARAVGEEQARLARVTADVARASARRNEAAVARAPATSGGLELASATPTESFGFGGKSVDLSPAPTTKNRYAPDDGYGGEDDVVGDLSHITVQRTTGAGSRVGVLVEGGARYAVKRPSAREVVLTLFATRAANLDVRRILDARDLRTSVLRVLPHVEEGTRDVVELTVELRETTSVRVAQDGTMLWLHIGG